MSPFLSFQFFWFILFSQQPLLFSLRHTCCSVVLRVNQSVSQCHSCPLFLFSIFSLLWFFESLQLPSVSLSPSPSTPMAPAESSINPRGLWYVYVCLCASLYVPPCVWVCCVEEMASRIPWVASQMYSQGAES